MAETRRIAIGGGGVAGLSAALALRCAGVPTVVYDKEPGPPPGGGAIFLFPNAVCALGRLGLGQAVVDAGTPIDRFEFRRWNGELLGHLSFDALIETHGMPLVHIGRQDLLRLLLDAVGPREVRWGSACRGFVPLPDGVRLLFERYRADAGERFAGLIGADGFHSVIRSQLLGEDAARLFDQVAWTGLAEIDAGCWPFPAGRAVVFLGRGRLLFSGTIRDGGPDPARRRVFWYTTEKLSRARSADGTEDLYRRFPPPAAALIERTAAPICFKVRDRAPARVWSRDRVTLLGDAAHPSTPDLSQGACQAIVGAATLGGCLERIADVDLAFRAYERRHRPRTERVVRLSRLMTHLAELCTPGADGLREHGIRTWWPPVLMHQYTLIHGPG